ncbi:hypothetical protein EV649_6604 [Kribbella sp. VKM Ac-2569]|uniref:hypothetical protein n=1 Tax=Kribbella sp. VKM Ac-2569 TaxID=2512220 RepID=UPI00102B8AE9|nr:hypothetical protein [Kribbella sp. VKM Ac-2569]RZT13413.1 hypothetical protein EV649_6604 [Kribbella sp. VKM Ac-2569]
MADQAAIGPADQAAPSLLDQAAADNSITQARTRAVDPVPIVAEPVVARSATLEPVLETSESDMGVNSSVNPEAQAVDGRVVDSTAAAPVAGARRRLSPRPVPVSRRRRPPAEATEATAVATDEERTPAEEMDDVGTKDEKATAAEADKVETSTATETGAGGSGTATATKTARPKTAAEIVAEQRAREKAAAEAPAADAAASEDAAPARADDASKDVGTSAADKAPAAAATGAGAAAGKPAAKPTGASGNKPAAAKSGSGSGMGKQALTSVGSGVRKLRNLIASLIWLVAVLAAAVLALGALFTALDQTNQSNEIVRWILERGHDLVGPFKDLFRLETAKNTLLVNWGIAALVYLIAGKILEKIIRP